MPEQPKKDRGDKFVGGDDDAQAILKMLSAKPEDCLTCETKPEAPKPEKK